MDFGDETLLVISPHADDETYGCAGTIAKVKAHGGRAYVVIISIGDLAQYGSAGLTANAARTRLGELDRVAELLKVDDYEVLYDDEETHLRLDTLPRRALVERLEWGCRLAINTIQPTMVAIPAPSYNQDHVAVFEAGFTACRPHLPALKYVPRTVMAYDNPTLCWYPQPFHPTVYVDISEHLDAKLTAFRLYESQQRSALHLGSVESVEALALVRGREIGVKAAEGFVGYRQVM